MLNLEGHSGLLHTSRCSNSGLFLGLPPGCSSTPHLILTPGQTRWGVGLGWPRPRGFASHSPQGLSSSHWRNKSKPSRTPASPLFPGVLLGAHPELPSIYLFFGQTALLS